MVQQSYSNRLYRQQDVIGASPIRLVVMAYDLAIQACEQQDFVRATQAVSVLRDALNFDYPEASVGLFRIYQWCLDNIRSGDYAAALASLRELRSAWVTAEKKLEAMSSPPKYPEASTALSSKPIARA